MIVKLIDKTLRVMMKHFQKIFLSMSIAFFNSAITMEQAEVNALAAQMKHIDKAELHVHLGGAWPLHYIKSIAEPVQFEQVQDFIGKIEKGIEYKAAFGIFELLSKIVNTSKKVEEGVIALCQNLAADGVVYAEIRTGLKDLGSGLDGYMQTIKDALEKGCQNTRLKAGILLSLRRDTSAIMAHEVVTLAKKYYPHTVFGIDVSGISVQGNGDGIFDALKYAKELGLPITLHIGESAQETAEQQMKELQAIRPSRVGHCVHLCSEAWLWVKEHKTPIELCPTSAVRVMIKTYKDHPGLALLKQGYPVAICTDDPLIFNVSLSDECARVAQLQNLTIHDIKELQQKTMSYAFFNKITP